MCILLVHDRCVFNSTNIIYNLFLINVKLFTKLCITIIYFLLYIEVGYTVSFPLGKAKDSKLIYLLNLYVHFVSSWAICI